MFRFPGMHAGQGSDAVQAIGYDSIYGGSAAVVSYGVSEVQFEVRFSPSVVNFCSIFESALQQ